MAQTYKTTGVSTYVREDEAIIHAKVDGVNFPSTYSWASLEGGDIEAEDVFTRPGGLQPGVNLGGPVKRSDVTVMRLYDSAFHAFIVQLDNVAGNASMSVSWTPLDADGNPNGGTVTISGVLKSVNKPNFNANNSGAVMVGLVMACNTEATMGKAPS